MAYRSSSPAAILARNSSIPTQDLENVRISNNIFQTTGGLRLIHFTESALDNSVGVRFEGNAYWPTDGTFKISWKGATYYSLEAFRAATGQEMQGGQEVGITADPELMAPGAGPNFNEALMIRGAWPYRLKATSLLIDAGIDLAALGVDVGPRDFFGGGSRRYNGADIGAHEWELSCNWTLTPTSRSMPASGGVVTVEVWAASPTCGWAALSKPSWITESPPAWGDGTGSVAISVAPNTSTSSRKGTVKIANRTFTITQAAGQ